MPHRFMETDPARRHHKRLNLRRLLGVLVMVALVWFLIWVGFSSGLIDPVVQVAEPFYRRLAAMINDPLGIDWGDKLLAAATVIIPHLLLLAFLFDDRAR